MCVLTVHNHYIWLGSRLVCKCCFGKVGCSDTGALIIEICSSNSGGGKSLDQWH